MSIADDNDRPISPWVENWRYFIRSRGAVVGLVVFTAMVLIALLAPWLAPHDPTELFRGAYKVPPAWVEGGRMEFLLGTDDVGHDILSRIMHGARYSLLIGVVVVAISLTSGIIIGLVAGYVGGRTDAVIMRIMDILLAFPSLLLALVLVAILGKGLFNAMLAIAVVLLPHFSRLTRSAVMAEKNLDYVTATRVAGAGHLRLMFVTILPNCLAPLIVQATLSFSNAILDAAALGFLGMGAQPPTPEWGTMLADGRNFITSDWWIVTMPGLAILITVIAINLIGDGLRDTLDPKLKRS
ncbi:MAG: ABC transporter permease subunit [Rubellimicrobium sp.]|nr:ABC transporter permease subunit [Rubellimicrobium sp.]